jgi:hypothetical protein
MRELRRRLQADKLPRVFDPCLPRSAKDLGCEGIVSKRRGSPYRADRSAHWLGRTIYKGNFQQRAIRLMARHFPAAV